MLARMTPGPKKVQFGVPQAGNLFVCSHSGQGSSSQISNFGGLQKHLEALLKTHLLGPTPRVSDSIGQG